MNCFVCDREDRMTEAVAICHHCGIALCREHVDEALLAERPAGLARQGCIHSPVLVARTRRVALPGPEPLW